MIGMTKRHYDCLQFVTSYMRSNNGIAPSYKEIADGLGLHSKSGVHRMMHALQERGHIKMMKRRKRAVQLVLNSQRQVPVSSEAWRLVTGYAQGNGVTIDSAVDRILRDRLEGAA